MDTINILKCDPQKIQAYANKLREEIYKSMKIKIPDIPMVSNPAIDVMFLERFLHVNGESGLEESIWEQYKDTLYFEREGKT